MIEAASNVRQVAFEKTGTLTHGRPQVVGVVPVAGMTEAEVIRLAAGVESGSSHPLAQAILKKAEGMVLPTATSARAITGKGVSATLDGRSLPLRALAMRLPKARWRVRPWPAQQRWRRRERPWPCSSRASLPLA